MKRLAFLSSAVVLVVGAGVAFADGLETKSLTPVAATFSATTASNVSTTTCTGADGTYTKIRGTYTGTASSSSTGLNGPLSIDALVVYGPANVGTVSGRVRVTSSGGTTEASLSGVLANGTVAGLANGYERGQGRHLLANISSAFSAQGGFTGGMIGGGTAAGTAIEIQRGDCRTIRPPQPERISAHGNVTAVSSASITAAGVTCSVPSSLQQKVASIHIGDRVEMHCLVSGGTSTLVSISTEGH